jgi:hypothetical protein
MTDHRRNYKKWINKKYNYTSSFELLKCEDAYIELLLEIEVESKQELFRIEGEQIRKHNCVNKNIAGRTPQEHYQDNAVQIAERHSNYYQKNKEKFAEYEANYRQENIVKILERQSNYRQDNAVKLAEQRTKPYTCECGSILTTAHKSRHCKSKKHQEFISTL